VELAAPQVAQKMPDVVARAEHVRRDEERQRHAGGGRLRALEQPSAQQEDA